MRLWKGQCRGWREECAPHGYLPNRHDPRGRRKEWEYGARGPGGSRRCLQRDPTQETCAYNFEPSACTYASGNDLAISVCVAVRGGGPPCEMRCQPRQLVVKNRTTMWQNSQGRGRARHGRCSQDTVLTSIWALFMVESVRFAISHCLRILAIALLSLDRSMVCFFLKVAMQWSIMRWSKSSPPK